MQLPVRSPKGLWEVSCRGVPSRHAVSRSCGKRDNETHVGWLAFLDLLNSSGITQSARKVSKPSRFRSSPVPTIGLAVRDDRRSTRVTSIGELTLSRLIGWTSVDVLAQSDKGRGTYRNPCRKRIPLLHQPRGRCNRQVLPPIAAHRPFASAPLAKTGLFAPSGRSAACRLSASPAARTIYAFCSRAGQFGQSSIALHLNGSACTRRRASRFNT